MTEQELRELLSVYIICGDKYLGEKSFDGFVDYIHNPPEEDELTKLYGSKPDDRYYKCVVLLNPEKCEEKGMHFAEDIMSDDESEDFVSSCNINFIRHYKKINLSIHLNPVMDRFPDELLFPVIQLLNKEFERGEYFLVPV